MEPMVVERQYSGRRKRKKSSALKAVFYLTSLLPAAWIVWHYDLLNKLDRRLSGQSPPQAQDAHPAPPTPLSKPHRQPRELAPVRSKGPVPRRSERDMPTPDPALVTPPRQTAEPPKDTSPGVPQVLHAIDLDLRRRVQRHELSDLKSHNFHILELKGCSADYEISPEDGQFDEKDEALVSISGPPDVLLRVALRRMSEDKSVIVIEPLAVTDEGDEIPLTLSKVKQIQTAILKNGRAASAELEAMQAERQSLQDWLAAPVLKSLGERGQAKARIVQLERAIPRQTLLVTSLEADFEAAYAVQKLASELHQRGQLQIGSIK